MERKRRKGMERVREERNRRRKGMERVRGERETAINTHI